MTYKIGIAVYDEDNMLWETKVGLNNSNLTLLYSVWGKTELESKLRAEELTFNLSQ